MLEPQFIAVGEDSRGSSFTILRSLDGVAWSSLSGIGGFNTAGYGIACSVDRNIWVAVGADPDFTRTIQYSITGGSDFNPVDNGFTGAGYGVTYNSSLSTFFAVGQDITGASEMTVKTSPNGINWFNLSSPSGFISQKNLGSANGLFTQRFLTRETVPYMNFSNLTMYERETAFLYVQPTIRLQSSFIAFNETLFMNLSSQVIIGSNVPSGTANLTVYGNVYADSIVTVAPRNPLPNLAVSSLTISTLSSIGSFATSNLVTPSFEINALQQPKANRFSTIARTVTGTSNLYGELQINDTLFVYGLPSAVQYPQAVGIGTSNDPGTITVGGAPNTEVVVGGTFGASTLSTSVLYALSNIYLSASKIYYEDEYLSIFEGSNPSLVTTGNRIQTNASSITFNSLISLQISTQRVGLYTRNPQFDLDCQRNAVITNMRASTINTSLIFLTLQSV